MGYNLVSIILPVYNQADHIRSVVDDYLEALANVPYEIEYILVVNACRDNSLDVCREVSEKNKSVKMLHSTAGGWGLAVKLGLQESKGDVICYTNVARTSPQDLTLLLLYGLSNPNVVIKANRKIRESRRRRIGSLIYNIECRALFDLSYWDINGTPKVFPRQFEKLLHLTRDDDLIDLEFDIVCRRENYPMLEVPVFSATRHGGNSTTTYSSALRMYLRAYKMWREERKQSIPQEVESK